MTDSDLLRAIGEACYGPHWKLQLVDYLGINYRTLRRWLAGQEYPTEGVWTELTRLVHVRRMALDKAALGLFPYVEEDCLARPVPVADGHSRQC